MADIFISSAHQDGDLVKEISPALEAAGYTTWYYEDKGAIGASYLLLFALFRRARKPQPS